MKDTTDIQIISAQPDHASALFSLVYDLAAYERMTDTVHGTAEDLQGALETGQLEAILLLFQSAPIAFASYYMTFSTFSGRPGLYIEDIYVSQKFQGQGFGKRLMQQLSNIALQRICDRMSWQVLDWNDPAHRFYEHCGAKKNQPWLPYTIDKTGLQALSNTTP